MRIIFTLILAIVLPLACCAKECKQHKYFEKDYQKNWCDKNEGAIEVILPDRARVDCVTKTHAIEFDFARKWAESIGQALYYGQILQKTPGIVLIIEDKIKDEKYIKRVQTVAKKQGITVWLTYPEDIN